MHRLIPSPQRRPPRTIIGLLRHGTTLWNLAGRIQGQHNSPLSDRGIQEVHHWGQFLQQYDIDGFIASDLGRVKETVAILQEHCGPVAVEWQPDLREQDWGRWQGKTIAELREKESTLLASQIAAGWDFCPPGGESRREVLQRALSVTSSLLRKDARKRVLLISHEGVIKALIYHLAARAFLPSEKKLLQKRQLHLLVGDDGQLALGPLNVFPQCPLKNP